MNKIKEVIKNILFGKIKGVGLCEYNHSRYLRLDKEIYYTHKFLCNECYNQWGIHSHYKALFMIK